jgi:hypothetical protein
MKYRIVKDRYAGYEVQEWRWWFPVWCQAGFANTHRTLEAAKAWLEGYRNQVVWTEGDK